MGGEELCSCGSGKLAKECCAPCACGSGKPAKECCFSEK